MKKTQYIFLVLIATIVIISSCNNDDDALAPVTIQEGEEQSEEQSDDTDLSAIIEVITGGGENTWEIQSALLTNTNITDLDITSLFNVQDDEFIFTSATNTSIDLNYNKGYAINTEALDLQSVESDTNRSSENISLTATNVNDPFLSSSGNYSFKLNEDNSITALVTINENTQLNLQLSEKTVDNYLMPPSTISSLTEVYYYEAFQPVLDMKYSFTTESIYMVSRKEVGEQQLIKYDTNTGNDITQNILGNSLLAQQLSFIDTKIYTVSSLQLDISNADLSGEVQSSALLTGSFDFRTASLDDKIYKIGGYDALGPRAIGVISPGDIEFTQVITMDTDRARVGAEIINNHLYVIGGLYVDSMGNSNFSEEMTIYNLSDMSVQTVPLPARMYSTFSARHENLIYIAGRKDNGEGLAITPYLTVYNLLDNSFQEIDLTNTILSNTTIMRDMTVSDSHIYFAIQGSGTNNLFGMTIYEAALN